MGRLRVGNIEVEADASYSGRQVVEMLNSVYASGIRSGRSQINTGISCVRKEAYAEGYQAGYDEAQREQYALTSALNTIKEYLNKEV